MKNIRLFFLVLAALFMRSFLIAQIKIMSYKGDKRKYIVYVPASYARNGDKQVPLVFNFHGGGMTMAEQMFYTQTNKLADTHGCIIVYPQGIKQDWNVGFGMPYNGGTDDMGFIDTLLSVIRKNYRIDSKKVFAMGLSRGGFLCQRIAAERSGVFAAVASVGAPLPDSVFFYQKKTVVSVGVMLVHGTADSLVKYNGMKEHYFGAEATFAYWIDKNGSSSGTVLPVTKEFDKNKTDGTEVSFKEVNAGKKTIALVTVKNGGHTWPGADAFNMGLPIGNTSQDVELNKLIWAFFMKNGF